jgi:uncharacterized protein (TIGR01777 family)
MHILITGGTGMIGKALTKLLVGKNYSVIILTRHSSKLQPTPGVSYADWDVEKQTIDQEAIQNADYVIHLAGAGIADKRWTKKRKIEIEESRTKGSALLVKALTENQHRVKAIVSASAIGWYGPDSVVPNSKPFVETDPANPDFLGETCKRWETSIRPVEGLGIRLAWCRTGIVLSNEGGAFPEFKRPLNFGFATILASGKQVVSWIHVNDLCRVYLEAIENEHFRGAFNAVAPFPVNNRELVLKIARRKNGKLYLPFHVPAFLLKTVLGELSIEVLKSATISDQKLLDLGFTFEFPTLDDALDNLIR